MTYSTKPQVIVIGAGIIGASLAWHLTQKGAQVTVIAPDFEAGGTATPMSFAWINASWNNPKYYYDFRRRSMEGWLRLATEVPSLQSVLQIGCGSLTWAVPPKELAEYELEHKSWGYDMRRVDRAEIVSREPALRTEGATLPLPEWALLVSEEGAVEPAQAARILIADAETHGARLVSGDANGLLKEGDGVRGVVLSDGSQLLADHVVLAAGTGCVSLCASVGITIPVDGRPGLLVHSKPTTSVLLNGLVIATNLHMRQKIDGRIVAGSGFAGTDPGANPEAMARGLLEQVRGMLKEQDGDAIEMDFFTVGYRPTPKDGMPILGLINGLSGLSLAVLHSGVTLAPIVGELMADQIVNGKTDPAMAAFALDRFGQASAKH